MNNEPLFKAIEALPLLARLAAVDGLEPAAGAVQDIAQSTDAYRGMSGATRASTVVYVATDDDPGGGAFDAAYDRAAALLEGFDGHDGQPYQEVIPEDLGPLQIRVVLTVPTDYIYNLENDNGGEKAFLADSMAEGAPILFAGAVAGLRGLFRD